MYEKNNIMYEKQTLHTTNKKQMINIQNICNKKMNKKTNAKPKQTQN
jgi:hypothetical protein